MENKKVMFVSTRETLITNGLLNKLRAEGWDPFYVYNVEHLSTIDGTPAAIVYYMEDNVSMLADLHTALSRLCIQSGKKVICIGSQAQYDIFMKDFSPSHVADFFERPLNMDRFLECVMNGPSATKQRKRVLIVDDDASYRQLVREWLKGSYDVSMANGGTQAIAMLSSQPCDLILLDYEMPIVPGNKVMEMIRALPQAENTPIVFLTGKDDENCIRQVLSLHPAGYLLKTVGQEVLLKKVEDVLRESEK